MMKGGKEEEKMNTSPMFPRLHVNDTDKGGPRAPPRNKMALYEQLSIPSQRFNPSSLPLTQPQNARNHVAPPPGQGNDHEGMPFSPFYASPSVPAYSADKVNTRSSDGENLRTTKMEFERRYTRHVNFKSADAVGSVAECSSSLKHDSSNTKNSCRKKVDEDDDFMVPTFNSENALCMNKEINHIEKRCLTTLQANTPQNGRPATFNDSVPLASSCGRPLEQTSISDAKSGKHERRCNEQKFSNDIFREDQTKKSLSHPEAGENLAEPSILVKSFSDREHPGDHGIFHESCGEGALDGPVIQSVSQSKASLSHKYVTVADVCNRTSDDKANMPLDTSDADKNDEMSDISMMDSISGLDISPDDVVGVIGPKQFWKARRAIVNQQRVFALQVFELHRVMKVQKLLAASPHLLLEENSCVTQQKSPVKNLPLESYAKPQTVRQNDSQKPNQNTDHQTEGTGIAIPVDDDALNKELGQPPRSSGPCSENTHPLPAPSDNRSNPWCFQPPPAHQWLVPVMSPSEGLIYKPYTGPCPPAASIMAPVYGSYSPMSLPAGFSVPQQQQQQNFGVISGTPMAPSYMQTPYSLPAMNPVMSSPAAEQTSPMAGPRPNLQTEQNSWSSCNMSFPKSDAFMGRPGKVHASKDSGLQGSTASSPFERAQGGGRDALPLFPMTPVVAASARPSEPSSKEHQTCVIRVVPRNAKSATESAARIFRLIQEERQQL